jgi:hypothetical protein
MEFGKPNDETPPPPKRVEWGRELNPTQREQQQKDDAVIAMGGVAIRRPIQSLENLIHKLHSPAAPDIPGILPGAEMPPMPPSQTKESLSSKNVEGVVEDIAGAIGNAIGNVVEDINPFK